MDPFFPHSYNEKLSPIHFDFPPEIPNESPTFGFEAA